MGKEKGGKNKQTNTKPKNRALNCKMAFEELSSTEIPVLKNVHIQHLICRRKGHGIKRYKNCNQLINFQPIFSQVCV